MLTPMVGVDGVCAWRESEVRRSVSCCCLWKNSGFIRREDAKYLTYFIKTFYTYGTTFCSFNAILKYKENTEPPNVVQRP
jgi:hypothetical protein